VRWNSAGANGGGGSVLSGEAASDAGLDPTQMHYVTSYNAAELRTFHCERVPKMPLSGLDPSMLIGFLCKTEADWIDLRRRVAEVRALDLFSMPLECTLGCMTTSFSTHASRA
jgi:cysteine protease ATG4